MPNANVIRERHDQIFYHFIFTLRDGMGGWVGWCWWLRWVTVCVCVWGRVARFVRALHRTSRD